MTSPGGVSAGGTSSAGTQPTSSAISSGGTSSASSAGLAPFNSTVATALPIDPAYLGSEPSSLTDFSHYLPPGVYTNPEPGPQLAINGMLPTSVGIVGQAIGFETFTQTVQIPADTSGALPTYQPLSAIAGVAPVNAIQTLSISGAPTAASFTITVTTPTITSDTGATIFAGGVQTTNPTINWTLGTTQADFNNQAADIQAALTNLSNVGANNVSVTADDTGTVFYIEFVGALAGTPIAQMSVPEGATFTGGTNAAVSISSNQAQQIIYIDGTPTGGTFGLSLGTPLAGGSNVSSALPFDISASTGTPNLQTAIAGLVNPWSPSKTTVGTGNVTVSTLGDTGFLVTFSPTLGAMPQLQLVNNALTGGNNPTLSFVQYNQIGVSPVQAVQTFQIVANSGTFTLTYGGVTSAAMEFNASPAVIQAALQSLSTIGPNNVVVTAGPNISGSSTYTVTFMGALDDQPVGTITGQGSSTLTPQPTQTLSQAGINVSTVLVTNLSTGQVYTENTDYFVVLVSGTQGTTDALYAIERTTTGALGVGAMIQVSYQFTDAGYYAPYQFYTYADVVRAYGQPFNLSTGQIQAGITLAAKFAFMNGASSVVCAAVQPSTSNGPTAADYGNALETGLADQTQVAVVITDTGNPDVMNLVAQHVSEQSLHRFERRGIVGADGTVTPVPSATRITLAQTMNNQQNISNVSTTPSRIMMVSPATFTFFSPELNRSIVLGGQYIAAALAGMTTALSPAMPLTKKTISGFTGVGELERSGMKDNEASNGLCVVEFTRQQLLQVRHGLSTNPASLVTREWSIVGQQDALVYTLRDYLESDNLIGQPIQAYTLMNVKGCAEAALQYLVTNNVIVNYTGLTVRQLASNPDVIQVSFNWLPSFPLNYILVTFSISLTTGNLTSNSGSTANAFNTSNSQQDSAGTANIAYPSASTYSGNVLGGQYSNSTVASDQT